MAAEDYFNGPEYWDGQMDEYPQYKHKPTTYKPHHFDKIEHKTEKAVLFRDGDNIFWLPKSQIQTNETTNVVMVPTWINIKYIDDPVEEF